MGVLFPGVDHLSYSKLSSSNCSAVWDWGLIRLYIPSLACYFDQNSTLLVWSKSPTLQCYMRWSKALCHITANTTDENIVPIEFCFVSFFDRVSLCSSGCPGSCPVDCTGLKFRNSPPFVFQVLDLKVYHQHSASVCTFLKEDISK